MARKPDAPCSRCGKLLWGGSSSLPAGKRRCLPCRRIEPVPYKSKRKAPKLREPRTILPRGTRQQRGYDAAHDWHRARALEAFTPGDPCARCKGPMLASDPIDLDHADDRLSYLGLAHAWCNRSHRPEGTTRPEARHRPCAICGSRFRQHRREQRTCSRACGTIFRLQNRAMA